MFIEIPVPQLLSIATDSDRMPRLYYHPNWIARKFFWKRLRVLHSYLSRHGVHKGTCLDFGTGSGVFLPTLATEFASVTAIDIETVEAKRMLQLYEMPNVRLIDADIYNADACAPKSFDVIMAPDVLEHFKELTTPVARIHEWLKDDGFLFTSLPTENFFTRSTRFFGRYEKPWDHYHTGYEVEEFLRQNGFRRLSRARLYPLFPMYLTSIWQKS